MVLLGVKENNGWLSSRWNLTYSVGWEKICRAVNSVYQYYSSPELLTDGMLVNISKADDILKLDEGSSITIRGMSTIVKCPVMITFYNQMQFADVTVPCMTDEFKDADYQKFNMSLGQYMDSIELAMYM